MTDGCPECERDWKPCPDCDSSRPTTVWDCLTCDGAGEVFVG